MDEKTSDIHQTDHVERLRGPPSKAIHHGDSERPVWEDRETYGPAGFKGIFSNKYVTLCAAFATMGGALFGYDQGVVSITLVMDQFLEVFPEVSENAAGAGFKKGLLTAMIELGAFLGAMNQGWLADKISRKWSILVAVIIFMIGSAVQTGSMGYGMLVAGRFIGGIGVGMLAMVAPLYISEIAPPEIRGTLLVLQELSIVTAIVAAFYTTYGTRFIPSQWSWRLPFLLQMVPAIFLGAGVPFLPYSPRWLAGKGRDDEALEVLCKLRGLPATDQRVLTEWFEIRSEVAYQKEVSAKLHPKLQDGSKSSRIKLQILGYTDCFRKGSWKRTHVGIGLMFFQQFVGINALIYYSPTLFATMGLNRQMQLDMSGVLNICQVVACLWSLWGMDRFGRRPLLLGGGVCMIISHFIIAVLMGKFQDSWDTHKVEGWVCVAFLLFFMLTFGATWGPIPWAMPSEVFSSSLRAKGVAYATMSNWFNNFIIGLITPPLVQNTGFGTYVFFCAFSALAVVWVYFVVPETNGRTLEQMDQVFHDNTGEVEKERRARIESTMAAAIWDNRTPPSETA
ncbi:general substrate transporter [Aaosphaeria arxii CBS 175.79]|uniref:General substrate transporter n=1 Tax=Aaosphaeria arxii CBS 175.79 TaxID=1450172 RepID=A0A6A5XJT9_9PLEO|nr:general substrate transporter [Aaosphaeria arxii CBS 175.79]KAF2013000.1 general substrate transporter [Aaosphaeria arxii CBS 175.79]